MTDPDYPMKYIGDDTESILYGDACKIVQELPPGSIFAGKTFLGHWCVVEESFFANKCITPRNMVISR